MFLHIEQMFLHSDEYILHLFLFTYLSDVVYVSKHFGIVLDAYIV